MQQTTGRANRNAMSAADTKLFSLGNRGWVFALGEVDQFCGANGAADAILVGEISSFQAVPIAFGVEATADRYNIIVFTKIVLRDLVSDKIIYSNPTFSYQYEYQVPEGSDFESVESEVLDKLAERFARSLVITMLEGF